MEYKQLQFKADAVGEDGRTFAGFASTPDLDQGGDIVVKGAFGRTLAQRGGVKMLWNHKSDLMPIGVYTKMEEREGGLYVEGKLSDTQLGRDAATLLKDGAIDSMSIGYMVKDSDYDKDGIRVIKDLDLYEVSLVNFPMNEKAVITQVKNLDVKEIERVLREAGLSKSQATAIACAGVKRLREASEEAKAAATLAELKITF
jgi:HK97 family phage prohead protease